MIAIVTVEKQNHIYDIYACLQCDDNRVLLRVSHCYWDIVVYDVPSSIIDFYVSQIKNTGCLDFTKYPCRIIEHNNTYNEPTEDDYERELYYQEQSSFER